MALWAELWSCPLKKLLKVCGVKDEGEPSGSGLIHDNEYLIISLLWNEVSARSRE
jgi:hypothetical protein